MDNAAFASDRPSNSSSDHPPTTTPGKLTGPGDLIAALPGILGFYPQESVVLVGLDHHSDPRCATLGPVMRADLTHAVELCDALTGLPDVADLAVYAVIVSRIPDSELVRDATEALFDAENSRGFMLVDACWHVSEIATGTPYDIVFGPAPCAPGEEPLADHWVRGTVASVMSSPAMKALLDNGVLPELSREDTFRYFDPLPPEDDADAENREALARVAFSRGVELQDRIMRGDRGALAAAAEACLVVHGAPERPLLAPWDEACGHDLLGEEEDRLAVATMLARSRLRDRLISDALTSPLPAAHMMIAVAKTFGGVIRANALCVWAIIAVDRGLVSWAVAALTAAQIEVPGHSFSEVLIGVIHVGKHDELTAAVREGSISPWS